ncbi:MAG: hypothetical protein KME35_08715 [Aphanocapsa sp. GSE-SYN-MK-11-07L]|jgi:tetratricopeptide (TPR) repeat protein|nr:hypothetical protein [Aphanocapsa sp. GSE-SYN-MK-11-07L]
MIQSVAEALERQDYLEAARLLQELPPSDPWVILYQNQLQEAKGEWEVAEEAYRQLLRMDHGRKLTTEARQGLQRIEILRQAQRQQALDQASAIPGSQELGMLVLEAIAAEAKTEAAKNFARIMKLEPYLTRLLLPSRGWRLYRSAPLAEIQVYGQELREAGIPLFWLPLAEIQQIEVLEVSHFAAVTPKAAVICTHRQKPEPFGFEFEWSEVSQRVEGLVPIFELVVEQDRQRKIQRKEQIQDHAQFCDLHLPSRNTILRIYHGAYQFQKGISLMPSQRSGQTIDQGTSWARWQGLQALFDRYLPTAPVWSEFTPFGESVLDQTDLLDRIHPHIKLLRRQDSYWDQAFQLYSCLAFCHASGLTR